MRQLILEGVGVCCTYPEGLLILSGLLERIKRTYEQNRQYGGEISEGNVLDTYKRVPVRLFPAHTGPRPPGSRSAPGHTGPT